MQYLTIQSVQGGRGSVLVRAYGKLWNRRESHRQYAFTRDKQFCNRKSDEFLFTELQESGLKKSGFSDG